MATFRTIKESGDFVTVHKAFVFDNKLSAKAKGILLYFLSRPDNWQIYTSEVVKHMNDGQKSINSGIQELIKTKYVHRIQKRTNNGVFNGYEYLVYEKPTEMPFSANGLSANGKTENRKGQTTNNNSTNNDLTNIDSTYIDENILSGDPTAYPYKDVIDYLNQQTGKNYKSTTKKNQTVIRARTDEGFSLDDFKRVIDNKVAEWKGTNMEKYLRPETLFGTKFEGYLNQELQPSGMDQLERMKYDPSYWD
ncbi:replication protein [Staphylococcus epidermidis]|uniref:conserved phage C-terminal domain-containing protein n=1 Tax=Staphylococcus epidermidis TaxID=1282 RepID=UPI001368A6FB|nr:conserved phage C-terminal domain-containing protein [Staphylococcus epidermidis]MEB6269210.1 conserved phage C-terminal domain-containing protein [Staphylococcus epidermidis]NAN67703.1 replication protein [Staphylococcus epidermidis]NAN79975.1 replication protein [Staphylococcus epidermidis]NAN89877.1 replication protein [Staphylococcus epidermidis]NAN96768.1 replication protein [Staphylococcus epidermidis]